MIPQGDVPFSDTVTACAPPSPSPANIDHHQLPSKDPSRSTALPMSPLSSCRSRSALSCAPRRSPSRLRSLRPRSTARRNGSQLRTSASSSSLFGPRLDYSCIPLALHLRSCAVLFGRSRTCMSNASLPEIYVRRPTRPDWLSRKLNVYSAAVGSALPRGQGWRVANDLPRC